MLSTRSTVDRLQLLYNYLLSKVPAAAAGAAVQGDGAPQAIGAAALESVPAKSVLKLYSTIGGRGMLMGAGSVRQSITIFLLLLLMWYYFSSNPPHYYGV